MLSDRRFVLVFAVAAACGCARVSSPLSNNLGGNGADADLAMPPEDAPDLGDPSPPADMAMAVQPRDLAMPRDLATATTPPDLAMPPDMATPPDLATPPDMVVVVGSCHLVVNEIQTGTTATLTEEFVEIYNPCTSAVTVDNFKLVYRAASNTNPRTGADTGTLYPLAGSVAAGAYLVYGGSGFTGTKNGTLASGIAASGAVGIRDAAGTLVDSVAYGTVPGVTFTETAAAPLPPVVASPGASIERLPNGADSDDNSHDFQAASASTPGAANH
jgi:hypothetical protein